VAATDRWWTEYGWARHGSQLQSQLYVNRRPQELTAAVLDALPTLQVRKPTLEWTVPLEKPRAPEIERFAEQLDVFHMQAATATKECTEQSAHSEVEEGEGHAADPPSPRPTKRRHEYWRPFTVVTVLEQAALVRDALFGLIVDEQEWHIALRSDGRFGRGAQGRFRLERLRERDRP
jgi:hypothetical protein